MPAAAFLEPERIQKRIQETGKGGARCRSGAGCWLCFLLLQEQNHGEGTRKPSPKGSAGEPSPSWSSCGRQGAHHPGVWAGFCFSAIGLPVRRRVGRGLSSGSSRLAAGSNLSARGRGERRLAAAGSGAKAGPCGSSLRFFFHQHFWFWRGAGAVAHREQHPRRAMSDVPEACWRPQT